MSNSEQIAQVAHDKWVTVSDSLRLLMINERMSESLVFWENLLFAHSLTKNKQFTFFVRFCPFFVSLKKQLFPHSLFFIKRYEWIAQVAYQKWAMWANRSGCSPNMSEWANHSFFWANCSFAHYSLIFFCKRWAICSENRWTNYQPWFQERSSLFFFKYQ